MIEINLLPGARKKTRGGGGSSLNIGAALAGFAAKVGDPYLMAAVVSSIAAAAIVGTLYLHQQAVAGELADREQKAKQDSTRFAAVLKEKHRLEAQRDSVLLQLSIIKQIDNDRYVWPHVMDEVSRALPPYTWLTSLAYLTPARTAPAAAPQKGEKKDEKKAAVDSSAMPLRFRIVGVTVDIQALTRFMRMLESSPFIQNVQLMQSQMGVADGKEVTQFQLEAEYQRPDSTAIRRVPIALSVR